MKNVAGDLLAERMQRAFSENPRGELYRTLSQQMLVRMLEQNVAEVRVSILHGNNDLEDKLADCGNYCAFLLRNHVDPLVSGVSDPESIGHIGNMLRGTQLSARQADDLVALIRSRVKDRVTNPDTAQNLLAHER